MLTQQISLFVVDIRENGEFIFTVYFRKVFSADAYTVNSRYLEVVGTIFYKFKLPEVQINLHFG